MSVNGRFPEAHYVVFSNPLPGREEELERWYEDVHIPDSLNAGLFDSVRRYRSLDLTDTCFLTLWGCDYADTENALSAVRPVAEGLRAAGRIEVVQEIVFQEFVFLDRVNREREVGRACSSGLTTYLSCWAEPLSLKVFEDRMSSVVAAAKNGERNSRVTGNAQYGHRGGRARAIILEEHEGSATSASRDISIDEGVFVGLPPFGKAVPIFPGGSPAPSSGSTTERPSRERMTEVWMTRWECVSARSA
mgnify:CR=1 FL=1|jgi:hypothetical protein